jgi:hypothetical protein
MRDSVLQSLLRSYEADDFSETTIRALDNLLRTIPLSSSALLLGASLNFRWMLPFCGGETNHAAGIRYDASWPRAALQARARLGAPDAVSSLMAKCDEMARSGQVSAALMHASFIHQPESIQFLGRYLEGNETLHAVDDQGKETPAAQMAAFYLGRAIIGFPVRHRASPGAYTDSDIELCRTWMKANEGRWKIRGGYVWETGGDVSAVGGAAQPSAATNGLKGRE